MLTNVRVITGVPRRVTMCLARTPADAGRAMCWHQMALCVLVGIFLLASNGTMCSGGYMAYACWYQTVLCVVVGICLLVSNRTCVVVGICILASNGAMHSNGYMPAGIKRYYV